MTGKPFPKGPAGPESGEDVAAAPFDIALIETDLLRYLTDAATHDAPRSDLMLAGYVVHHLSVEEKQRFFTRCREALAPAGSLVFYDRFRRPGETRDRCVAA